MLPVLSGSCNGSCAIPPDAVLARDHGCTVDNRMVMLPTNTVPDVPVQRLLRGTKGAKISCDKHHFQPGSDVRLRSDSVPWGGFAPSPPILPVRLDVRSYTP